MGEIEMPPRRRMLLHVADLVSGARNRQHGDPDRQLALAGRLKRVLQENAEADLLDGEWEAIGQIVTKLSRIVCGKQRNLDNAIDIAGYASILYEIMQEEEAIELPRERPIQNSAKTAPQPAETYDRNFGET